MLLTNAKGMLYEVPDEMLSGLTLSDWADQKEEILALFASKMQRLTLQVTFLQNAMVLTNIYLTIAPVQWEIIVA